LAFDTTDKSPAFERVITRLLGEVRQAV
jgi:hypothetical protein